MQMSHAGANQTRSYQIWCILTYPAGWRSCTKSVCHLDAPPVFLKLGVTSVAMRSGQRTVTPGTPGTCGTWGFTQCQRIQLYIGKNSLHGLRSRHNIPQASFAAEARDLGHGKIPRFFQQSKDQARPFVGP